MGVRIIKLHVKRRRRYLGEIYDPSRSVWQPWFYQGNRVKLAQNQEQFFFNGASGLVSFVKPATIAGVGLTLFYA